MAKVSFRGEEITDSGRISMMMQEYGMLYEKWNTRPAPIAEDSEVIAAYRKEIDTLNAKRGYVTCDLVALKPETPNLETIIAKFDKEHHHTEDEVRFVVEGEGVFELATNNDDKDWIKFLAQPGDLIVIPANRRHLFYLTEQKKIRCIRLFKNDKGWEALYKKED